MIMKKVEILRKVWRRFAIIDSEKGFEAVYLYEIIPDCDYLLETKVTVSGMIVQFEDDCIDFCDLDGYELSDLVSLQINKDLRKLASLIDWLRKGPFEGDEYRSQDDDGRREFENNLTEAVSVFRRIIKSKRRRFFH